MSLKASRKPMRILIRPALNRVVKQPTTRKKPLQQSLPAARQSRKAKRPVLLMPRSQIQSATPMMMAMLRPPV